MRPVRSQPRLAFFFAIACAAQSGIDIEQVAERILLNLSGDRPLSWEHLPGDLIIASRDFNPSNFATMDLQKVRGPVLESGGRTSHTAIISRGLRLPAVMGIRDLLASVSTGDVLLLDGDEGQVIVNPARKRIENLRERIEACASVKEYASAAPGIKTVTRDGVAVSLRANTELPHELKLLFVIGKGAARPRSGSSTVPVLAWCVR